VRSGADVTAFGFVSSGFIARSLPGSVYSPLMPVIHYAPTTRTASGYGNLLTCVSVITPPPRYAPELGVEALPEVVLGYAERCRVPHENPQALEDRLPLAPFGDLRHTIGHDGPDPGAALQEAFPLELVVRLNDGVGGYRELSCEPPHGRQLLPWFQAADLDRAPYLGGELDVDRNTAPRVYVDPDRYDYPLFALVVSNL
jgi:hypothetical protein